MEKRSFCTIITADYLSYAYALRESLEKQNIHFDFHILVSNGDRRSLDVTHTFNNVFYHFPEDFRGNSVADQIYQKHASADIDALRWSFKPILINSLLVKGYRKVVYVDSDLFFFNSCEFIFDELDRCQVLLAPHWRDSDPSSDAINFEKNFKEGIYNGGFVAASAGAEPAMDWWAKACAYKCMKDFENGLYVDQKYLDFLASKFPKVGVLSHRGCNLADWNQFECPRTLETDGRVLINHQWEVVFVHFTRWTVERIVMGMDPLLSNHLKEYVQTLRKYKSSIPDIDVMTARIKAAWAPKPNVKPGGASKTIAPLRARLRIGTRVRKFLDG